MEIVALGNQAKAQLATVTGLKPVAVTRIDRNNGGWHVNIDMLEMARIPSSTDILGVYEAVLADDGALVSYERKRIRVRCHEFQEDGDQ